jgi:hypothetical protein
MTEEKRNEEEEEELRRTHHAYQGSICEWLARMIETHLLVTDLNDNGKPKEVLKCDLLEVSKSTIPEEEIMIMHNKLTSAGADHLIEVRRYGWAKKPRSPFSPKEATDAVDKTGPKGKRKPSPPSGQSA